MPIAGRNLVHDALFEIGAYDPVQPPSAEDADFVLRILNRIVDNWNAERAAIYETLFLQFTLTPNLQPHTIGPSAATFTAGVTSRPVDIEGATLILTNVTPNVRSPINIRDRDWWRRVSVQGVATTMPSDLYYDPAWPNGNIYLWPVPQTAFKIELQVRLVLTQYTLATNFSLPPGYQDALTRTLAEAIAPTFRAVWTPKQDELARDARARIFGNNDFVPRIKTCDDGMPSQGSGSEFNYLTREIR